MTRELKFRAWHPVEKKMWMDVGVDDSGNAVLDTRNRGLQYLKGESVVMQYTGLKDKNGKEIYEGDIVRWEWLHNMMTYAVEWDKTRAMFRAADREGRMLAAVEVIGNIYENPERVK